MGTTSSRAWGFRILEEPCRQQSRYGKVGEESSGSTMRRARKKRRISVYLSTVEVMEDLLFSTMV
jgi:hypothetical protein